MRRYAKYISTLCMTGGTERGRVSAQCTLLWNFLNIQLLTTDMNHCFNDSDTQIDPSLRRSLFKIVWTCATTLFACTYVAIHPNISVDESDGVVLLRRIGLMIAMGVVPELVVLWALQQRLLASSLRIIHRGKCPIGWFQRLSIRIFRWSG